MHDNSYFDDNDRGIMWLETIKLTNNIYETSIPVNNTPITAISYIKSKYILFYIHTLIWLFYPNYTNIDLFMCIFDILYRSVVFNNLFLLFIFTSHIKKLFLKYKKT